MKQFASDIERSTPEPCWPVVRTFHSPSSLNRTPRWYSVRPGTLRRSAAESPAAAGTRVVAAPGEMQQRVAHELVEGDHHRHRIAGQAEEERVADRAERHRPARAHGDLPEQHFAELRHQLLDEVGLADRDAAGGDDGVGALGGAA